MSIDAAEQAGILGTNAREEGASPPGARLFSRQRSRALIIGSLLSLLVGWHVTWPDLNRDFNHLHGWGHCQDAHLGRTIAEEGLIKVGFAPVLFKFFDAGANYRYYTHYPILTHAAISVIFDLTSPANAHRALRLAGMAVTVLFLCGLYLLGEELYGPRFAAWVLFLGAVNAQTFYFGVFPSMTSFALLFAVWAYWAYLRWRRTRGRASIALCALSLCGGYLSTFFFYPAALPLAVDLCCCFPSRGRRHRQVAGCLIALPVVFFIGIQLYYRYGIALVTGKEIYTTSSAQNLAHRTHYELLLTFDFYKQLVQGCLWYLSPSLFVAAAAYYASRLAVLAGALGEKSIRGHWKGLFIVLTLALAASILLFPQSTLDHQFMYKLLIPPLALAGAAVIYELESITVKSVIVLLTAVAAFGNSKAFTKMNNSPQWEFRTGVALSLFTPKGSFVRTALDENYYFMLLYYAHRNLLFNVPEKFRPVGVTARFDLLFGATVPADACALLVSGTNAVVVDHAPRLRPKLSPVHATYGNGAYELVAGRVTASYENMHLVEMAWRQNWPIVGSVGIEIGQVVDGQFVSLGRFTPRGGCADTSDAAGAPAHREVYLVETRSAGLPMVMRLFDAHSERPFHDDAGKVEISLAE